MRHWHRTGRASGLGLAFAAALGAAAAPPGGVTGERAEALAARGDLAAAILAWREALSDSDAVDPYTAWIRIAELERDLGRPNEGLPEVRRALALAESGEDRPREAAARGVLASLLRASGDLDEASRELTLADSAARASGAGPVLAAVLAERAHLAVDRGSPDLARQLYTQVTQLAESQEQPLLGFEALVERANLAVEADALGEDPTALLEQARAAVPDLPTIHRATLARIRLARTTDRLARGAEPSQAEKVRELARADLDGAHATATVERDVAASSWALGTRAELEVAAGQLDRAAGYASEALRAAQLARLADAELRWQALLGRLLKQRGDLESALPHLRRASDLLAERRASRAAPDSEQESTAEIYRDLVDVLLLRSDDMEIAEREQALREAQRTMERFRVTELRDYFRDECVDAYREKIIDPASASPSAAVLYPIVLEERLEILVSQGGRIERITVEVPRDQLESAVLELRQLLVKRTTRQYLRPARQLHDWLIAGAAAHWDPETVDTLVFVPGGLLRTIPMAALHDGESFLIERYGVATTPGLELTDPRPIDPAALQAFVGGLSRSVEGFPALAHVPEELASVAAETGARPHLDEGFKAREVLQTLDGVEFSVVHMATHGEFGATPADTFLLTYEGRIHLGELSEAVGAFRYRETPLELLFLSACETAAGDERSALGLSGIAIQAGARSAVGSLWRVNDAATQRLVEAFYRGVALPGVSRAQALRAAQLALLADTRYQHPYYWAPFLLIGGWL